MDNFNYKKYLAEGKLLKEEGTYRVYMNSDPDEPERIDYERYFGDGTKAEMIKQAKKMAYSNDPTNQYGDPILVKVVHEDDIDDVAWSSEDIHDELNSLVDEFEDIDEGRINESSKLDQAAGGYPYKMIGNKAVIVEPMDTATKERAIRKAKSLGLRAKPNMQGGINIYTESVNENIQDNQWTAYVKSLINDIRLNGVEQYTGFREDDILEDFENYIADKF